MEAFRSLVGLQALTRAVNFALTTALARKLGPELIGLANVQLQLVAASALFFAKEGFVVRANASTRRRRTAARATA